MLLLVEFYNILHVLFEKLNGTLALDVSFFSGSIMRAVCGYTECVTKLLG